MAAQFFLKIEPRSKITDLILKALYDLLFSIFFPPYFYNKIRYLEISGLSEIAIIF